MLKRDARLPEIYKRELSGNYDFLKSQHSVYIHGDGGTGKSHLATLLLMNQLYENATVNEKGDIRIPEFTFLLETEFILELKASFKERLLSEWEIVNKYVSLPFLLLDDLGVSSPGEWSRGSLYTLLEKRRLADKAIIITSNFGLDELAARLDDRLSSRIAEICYVHKLSGEDYRVTIAINRKNGSAK